MCDANEKRKLQFLKRGWLGPFPLLDRCDVKSVNEVAMKAAGRFPFVPGGNISIDAPWFKSLHAYEPVLENVVTLPKLIDVVRLVLGKDLLLWGTAVTIRSPGQRHRWHVDVEHTRWSGVTAFIGLEGASVEASLKVLSGSHKIGKLPQNWGDLTDREALTLAKSFAPEVRLETVPVRPGEFFVFAGELWHASANTGAKTRTSIIAQYTTPDHIVTPPLNYSEPIEWSTHRPPCLIVSGVDSFQVNTTYQVSSVLDGAGSSSSLLDRK